MVFMQWRDEFAIGVPFVDADHKVLVDLINQVAGSLNDPEEYATLGSVLSALSDYTDYHFAREEALMRDCSYDGFESHHALHEALKKRVHQLRDIYQADPKMLKGQEVLAFLEHWLVDHICKHDKAYAGAVAGNAEAEQAAGAMQMQAKPFTWADLSVLVVDDNDNFRTLIQTILASAGVRRIEAVNCAAAGLERLADHPVDLVISDWYMAAMDGLEFTRRIRASDGPTAATKVIMLSGQDNPDLETQALAAGVNAFLKKPMSARDLLLSIAGLMTA